MKIGINASFLRKRGTGIGQVTLNFILKLAESGENSQFFLYTEDPIDLKLPKNFKIKTFLPQWWKRDDAPRKWLWEKQVAREAVKDDCDVFISLYQSSTIFHSSYPIKHIMIAHDIIPKLFQEYRGNFRQKFYWKKVERGMQTADHIVAISENTKNDLMRELGIPEEKISVAYLDSAPRFNAMPSEEKVASVLKKYDLEKGYIYHGGGLEIRKNGKKLLQAYAKLVAREEAKNIPLLVISGKIFDKSNPLATDVRGLIEKLELRDKVKLLGFVPDENLPSLYRGALFFVYPSLYEGFGLPVLEALRMGVPVLTSDNSSLKEVGGGAALYADPKSTEILASQMLRLLTDETLRVSLISQSAKQVVKFNWDSFMKKILEICI